MRRPSWSVILVFAVIAIMLAAINARPAFPDPDSFYHAKMALLIRDHGFIHQFPWMQETTWRDNYVDVHLLYHILLIPFVTVFDPLVGMKVSAVVFGLVAFYAIYRFLRSIGSPYPEWLTLAAAFSFDFLSRAAMPRAPALSVVLLLACTWALLRSRPVALFLATAAMVWMYHGWLVVVPVYLCFLFAKTISRRLATGTPGNGPVRADVFRLGAALFFGIVAALVINPYFPANILTSVAASLRMGLEGSGGIAVGAEWSSPVPWKTMLWNVPTIIALFVAISLIRPARAVRLIHPSLNKTEVTLTLAPLAIFFCVLAFRSSRYAEYFVPVVLLLAGSILAIVEPFFRREVTEMIRSIRRSNAFSRNKRIINVAFRVGCLAVVTLLVVRGVRFSVDKHGTFSETHYKGSADWLRANLSPGGIVFNPEWDSSMVYFYLDDSLYQLVGLDPRLMSAHDGGRYQDWMDLSSGVDADVTKIRSEFNASAVLIDRHFFWGIVRNLESSGLYEKSYEDEWTQIYTPIRTL